MMPSDEAYCRQIARAHARTFWIASNFLPAEKRRAAFAIYAFCRVADDIVDAPAAGAASNVAAAIAAYRTRLATALDGSPEGPVFREVVRAIRTWGVPERTAFELIDGVARDAVPARYLTWDSLESYCQGVASSVGEMCTYVFGVDGGRTAHEHACAHARALGVAMQLTNILRDVGEDARNGRCYLPDEDLVRFGLDRAEIFGGQLARDERWKSFMRFEIARARALYAQATQGIALLAPDARRCATACATGYAGILGAIEAIDYDTFSSRASLSPVARASVLWAVWRAPLGQVNGDVRRDDSPALSA